MHTPEQAKRRIIGLGVVAVAIPTVGLIVALVVGHRPLALFSGLFVVLAVVGSVRAGRQSWQAYLEGPPDGQTVAD